MNGKIKLGIVVGVLAMFAVAVCGCTSPTNTDQNINSTGGASDAAMSVKLVSQGMQPSLGPYTDAGTGHTFAVYTATVKNVKADDDRSINEFNFKLRDTTGNVYEVDLGATSADGAMHAVMSTKPGDVVTGTIAFNVPVGTIPKSITYDDGVDTITTNL
jgi:CO dehydrogenase/acetyl-CoA synthase delta subunit